MKSVIIKLDPKRVHKNAFYFSLIQRVIIRNLGFDDYFNMQVSNKEIEITSDNETIIASLNGFLKEDEND